MTKFSIALSFAIGLMLGAGSASAFGKNSTDTSTNLLLKSIENAHSQHQAY